MLAGCIEFSWRVIYRSAFKRRNHSLNSQLRQLTNYKELYLTTDTLQFFVNNTSLWSGVQCFYKQFLLWLLLLNFIASQLVTVWLIINATFWSDKTMVYMNLVSVTLALHSVTIKGTKGLCSSRAQWPLAPNVCSRATSKSYFFHTNHMLGTLDFTVSEHWAPFNFP